MSLTKAIQLARLNPIKPIGRNSISRFCAILTNGRETYTGYNQYRTHPLQAKFGEDEHKIHIHCELDAIIKAIRSRGRSSGKSYRDITDLSDFNLYVARVLKDGSPALSMPCSGCARAISSFNIRSVQWTV